MGYTCAPADGAFYAFVKVAGDDNRRSRPTGSTRAMWQLPRAARSMRPGWDPSVVRGFDGRGSKGGDGDRIKKVGIDF